jgi:hypothetical protein
MGRVITKIQVRIATWRLSVRPVKDFTLAATNNNNNDKNLNPLATDQNTIDLEANMNVHQAATTTFQDDGNVVKADTRIFGDYKGVESFDNNEIKDFMAKPYRVVSGNIIPGEPANFTKCSFSIADTIEANDIWKKKIYGYKLIRGTAVVKVVLNATPFQAGRVIGTFLPCYKHMTTSEQNARNTMLGQVTTQPNIELDVIDSSFEMRIPYITPSHWYDRTSGLYDWGTFFLKILSPLNVGSSGDNSINYAVFLHFEDFELAAPTYTPESGIVKPTIRSRRREQKQAVAPGPISGTLSVVADKAQQLGSIFSFIPGSEAIFNTGAAVASKLADIASIFGYSKPMTNDSTLNMQIFPLKYLNNSSGVNPAAVLAYSHDQQIAPVPGIFGTRDDEMSFAYLKTIAGYVTSFTWSKTDVPETQLYDLNVFPPSLLEQKLSTKSTSLIYYRCGSPLFMMARLFDGYRGGVKITLKFVKTKFHTGRLAIQFQPKVTNVPNIDQAAYIVREIVDLKESDTITLRLPYLFGVDYLHTSYGTQGPDSFDYLGNLRVYVLNELRAPETCSTDIKVLVYAQPDDDFEYVGFSNNKVMPFTPESALGAQTKLVTKPMGDSQVTAEGLDPNLTCYGDPILSIKQLLVCSRRFAANNNSVTTQAYFYPASCALSYNTTGAASVPQTTVANVFGDYIQMLSHGYAFCRGGYRYTCMLDAGSARAYLSPALPYNDWEAEPSGEGSVGSSYQPGATGPSNQNMIFSDTTRSVLDVVVPGYSRCRFRMNRYTKVGNTWSNSRSENLPDKYNLALRLYASFIGSSHSRAGADDFTLGYFIGFMPLAW